MRRGRRSRPGVVPYVPGVPAYCHAHDQHQLEAEEQVEPGDAGNVGRHEDLAEWQDGKHRRGYAKEDGSKFTMLDPARKEDQMDEDED